MNDQLPFRAASAEIRAATSVPGPTIPETSPNESTNYSAPEFAHCQIGGYHIREPESDFLNMSEDEHIELSRSGLLLDQPKPLEELIGSPLVGAGATVGAAAVATIFPHIAIAVSALPLLVMTPAAIRFRKRVEHAFREIDSHFKRHEEAIQNLTDGQYEFVASILGSLLQTVDERKLDLLKTAVRNGIEQSFDHYEAEVVARILRDITVEEAQFFMRSRKFQKIDVFDGELKNNGLTIKHSSPERLIVAGLASLGLLMQSDSISIDVNSYQFSAIAPKVAALLSP